MNMAREKLTYLSNHDLMTGLFNRRFFEHIMQRNKFE
ncbi:MAG: GGDEF domain-containing protein [Treponema sp.]|nr:GGDEF domain-containing protein [Treponema sp.]